MGLSAALVCTGIISVQFGAGVADKLFGTISPAAVTTLRLWSAAALMLIFGGRSAVRSAVGIVRRRAWLEAATTISFGMTLGVMNFSIYQAFARIPLGVAVTIEFLGPLTVSVASSRRRQDFGWALLGALGVALLAGGTGGSVNLTGVGFAVLAGGCWAAYILLSRANGRLFPGPSGLVMAMLVAAVVVTPPGLSSAGLSSAHLSSAHLSSAHLSRAGSAMFRPRVLAEGAAVGALSSVIPYWIELEVLRRIPARVFGVWMSLEPAAGALIGLVMLGQQLSAVEWFAISCVIVACAGAARSA
jgi:inner membrane transporter RhtA